MMNGDARLRAATHDKMKRQSSRMLGQLNSSYVIACEGQRPFCVAHAVCYAFPGYAHQHDA